jgi:hypothetical protein
VSEVSQDHVVLIITSSVEASASSIIVSSLTVLARTLAASHRRYRNLFRHSIRLLWTNDQPVAKASTYKGQHDIETHALRGIRTQDVSVQAIKTFSSDRPATGTGRVLA